MSRAPGKEDANAQKGASMSVVTIAEAWPAADRPFTVTELDRMPAGGARIRMAPPAAARVR